jgi:hypothetical protein
VKKIAPIGAKNTRLNLTLQGRDLVQSGSKIL